MPQNLPRRAKLVLELAPRLPLLRPPLPLGILLQQAVQRTGQLAVVLNVAAVLTVKTQLRPKITDTGGCWHGPNGLNLSLLRAQPGGTNVVPQVCYDRSTKNRKKGYHLLGGCLTEGPALDI
jgi:hypothetical protein